MLDLPGLPARLSSVNCFFTITTLIASFRHKGLKRLFERDDTSGVGPALLDRVRNILSILQVAETLSEIDLPSLRLHALKGDRKGFHAITVRANWRIVFRFQDGDCHDVDLVDYH